MSEPKVWLERYTEGVPATINPDLYPSLNDMYNEVFRKYKNNPAFSYMGKKITFGQLDQLAQQFAAYLQYTGLKPGDRIALMMPNMLQYPIALFGAFKAGVVVVNTNPLYTPREMLHQFTDAGATAIVIAENFAHNLEKILSQTSVQTIILASAGEMLPFPKSALVNYVVRKVRKMVPAYTLPGAVTFSQALKTGKRTLFSPVHTGPEDTVLLQYTGGTTGLSKGAMLTNRNLVSNVLQFNAMGGDILNHLKTPVVLCALPLYHIFAFTVNALCFMYRGGMNVLVINGRDIPSIIKEFKTHRINIMTGVNTLFNALLNHPEFSSVDFSGLVLTGGGGTAVQVAVAERWKQVTGCDLTEGYGMTETSAVSTINPLGGHGRLGTIGVPIPSTDVRIVDEEGNVLSAGQTGEIQVKGPQIMKGYYNQPEASAQILKDGWLSTGDVGMMHEDGFFQIVDRKKDMILVSGFNVFPNEIESVLAMHPKVFEAAAVAVPDEKSGEAVKVYVVKKDDSLTEEELIAFCRENLTGYKIPRLVEFIDQLPKTNVGKILRRVLKDDAAEKAASGK
ncbi:MAG: Long-chain-fatty-acid--CoA ligase [Haliscomenobacter sp.]|nr:Long-chain-fatty-acid--CoA ligase [Haliscomenobacter sp.]